APNEGVPERLGQLGQLPGAIDGQSGGGEVGLEVFSPHAQAAPLEGNATDSEALEQAGDALVAAGDLELDRPAIRVDEAACQDAQQVRLPFGDSRPEPTGAVGRFAGA